MSFLIPLFWVLTLIFPFASSQYASFNSSDFNFKLDKSSQTLASLSPKSLPTFDFSPFDILSSRSANGNYHLGDVTLRYRRVGDVAWTSVDSAAKRAAVLALFPTGEAVSVSNLSPTLPKNIPLNITRAWGIDSGDITLSISVLNTATTSIELGAFGFPIEFNSIFTGRTALDTETKCSLTDPNIGLDGGYLRVTPLSGTGPALVVTPLGKTPFEAWRFLAEDTGTSLSYQSQTFEGFYSWEVFSKAYTGNEWNGTTPWNPGTSKILSPGQSITLGLKFSLAPDIQRIESVIQRTNTPLVIGTPGYIIPKDVNATLCVYHNASISSINIDPAGAFNISSAANSVFKLTPTLFSWGRVRVAIQYADNTINVVHYYITNSAPTAISQLGNFLTTSQWFNNTSDPFERSPSVISYDRSVNSQVTQEARAWIAGLSDEAGAGSWLAGVMKQAVQPNAIEVSKLEQFVRKVLWGNIQQPDFSVRKSVFFYQPNATSFAYSSLINWGNWWSWNKAAAYDTTRSYDYIHVTAAYWAMYRVAKSYPTLVTEQNWQWYLNQAYQTVVYCFSTNKQGYANTGYSNVGLMGETVLGSLLQDLQRENLTSQASIMTSLMKARALLWSTQAVPYGSEMAWDSTGQEGVYYWTSYFNQTPTPLKTISSILGYTPLTAHWGWNGNARRYWDNVYGGKLQRIERQIHHYGSALNSLPLLSHFQSNPTDIYALRVGYAGNSAPLSNIDQQGFASASFHSWPQTLQWDSYSGDYGPGFLGLVLGSGVFVVDDPELGSVAFGGEVVAEEDGTLSVFPRDAVRRRVYLGMFGWAFEIDAGVIQEFRYNNGSSEVGIVLAAAPDGVPGVARAESAVLWMERKANVSSKVPIIADKSVQKERGGWKIDLSEGVATVNISLVSN